MKGSVPSVNDEGPLSHSHCPRHTERLGSFACVFLGFGDSQSYASCSPSSAPERFDGRGV